MQKIFPIKISYLYRNMAVFLTLAAVLYYSYIPFYYIVYTLKLNKDFVFIIIVIISILLRFKISIIFKFRKNDLVLMILYLLFAVFVSLSYVFSDYSLFLDRRFFVLTFVNIVFIIFALSLSKQKYILVKILFILSCIYFVIVSYKFFSGMLVPAIDGRIHVFPFLELSGYQGVNNYLGYFILTSYYFLFRYRSKKLIVLQTIFVLLTFYYMFLIGGRSAIVCSVMTLFAMFLGSLKINATSFAKILLLMILIFSIVYLIVTSDWFYNLLAVKRTIATIKSSTNAMSRFVLYKESINLFFENWKTIVFGGGMGAFAVYIGSNNLLLYPHNLILELLSEYGIVGFTLFFLPIIYILIERKKKYGSLFGETPEEKVIFSLFIYQLLNSMFISGLMNSWCFIFFMFVINPNPSDTIHSSKSVLRYREDMSAPSYP